nr:hypothetical protein [Tanacetum cinerariifolium]
QPDADWAIADPYLCPLVMGKDVPFWPANGINLGVLPIKKRKWWKNMRLTFENVIPTYLDECGVLKAKCISLETYKIKIEVVDNVPTQGDAYGDCGVCVCIFLHRLCQNLPVGYLSKGLRVLAQAWFTKTTLKATYQELVYPLKVVSMREAPNDLQRVLPLSIVKPQPGRPKNTYRILSIREAPSLAGCSRCGIRGHNRNACNQPLPSQKGKQTQKRRSYNKQVIEEHLTGEALKDEEWARNGQIYQDWDDVVQPTVLIYNNYKMRIDVIL